MSSGHWAVLVGDNGQGNPVNPGYRETVLDQPSEEAARKIFEDHVTAAMTGRWASVKLRKGGEIIDG
jgi:hypothetical protein